MPETGGSGPAGIAGAILDLLSAIFGGEPNPFQAITGIGNIAFSSLQLGSDFLRETVTNLKNIFKSIWDTVIIGTLKKLLEAYAKIRAFLQRIFGPIVTWLKRLRKWYDDYFNRFVKPMLKIIRQFRQVLQIFKLLGFKWAARLDARLAQIETKIVRQYEIVRQTLNQAISWLDLIIDPTFLLRRNPLFGAIIRSAPELVNLTDRVTQHTVSPDEQDAMDRARTSSSRATYKEDYATYFSQGQLPPDVAESRNEFARQIDALVNG
jgi:hypothetical protein